jgi:hypothetical protein
MTTDFRAFLGATKEVVLPYFGGTRVDAPDRRFRIGKHELDLEPGQWWRWKIDGRNAVPIERGQPVDLSDRPAIRGHWVGGWLFASGRDVHRVAFPPEDEPSPLARITARRWHSGDILFDSVDFEDEAEFAARDALERGQAIATVKGAVPSLRAAFGFAVASALGRELGVPVSPREVAGQALAIADGGRDAARRTLDDDPVERVDNALDGAGARMLRCRRLAGNQLDVRFQLDGEHYSTIVNADTLQVMDAGICLSGSDRELTLDSLPSVIREAVRTGRLHITRHD